MEHERLEVYQCAVKLNREVRKHVLGSGLDFGTRDQLLRAMLSISANIAEGTGRRSGNEARYHYNVARGSAIECLSILDVIVPERGFHVIEPKWRAELVSISKMLYILIHRATLLQDRRAARALGTGKPSVARHL